MKPNNEFLSEAFAYALGYWQGRATGCYENENYQNMNEYNQLLYNLGYESGVGDYCRLDMGEI